MHEIRHVYGLVSFIWLIGLCGCAHLRMPAMGAWSWHWPPWTRRADVTADEAIIPYGAPMLWAGRTAAAP